MTNQAENITPNANKRNTYLFSEKDEHLTFPGWAFVIRETYVHNTKSKNDMRNLAHVCLRSKQDDGAFWRWGRHHHYLQCHWCCQQMWSIYLATTKTCLSCWSTGCIGRRIARNRWSGGMGQCWMSVSSALTYGHRVCSSMACTVRGLATWPRIHTDI